MFWLNIFGLFVFCFSVVSCIYINVAPVATASIYDYDDYKFKIDDTSYGVFILSGTIVSSISIGFSLIYALIRKYIVDYRVRITIKIFIMLLIVTGVALTCYGTSTVITRMENESDNALVDQHIDKKWLPHEILAYSSGGACVLYSFMFVLLG